MNADLNQVLRVVPEHVVACVASIQSGGTGRFDLIVATPYETGMAQRIVCSSLSKGQAETAARIVNEAFAAWLPHTGTLLVVPKDGE